MTFSYLGADLSKIIKKFTKNGTNYHIEYLDGSESNYYHGDPNHGEYLKKMMIEQAKERQKRISLENQKGLETNAVLAQCSSIVAVIFAIGEKSIPAVLLFGTIALCTTIYAKSERTKRKELEKYQLFFNMEDDLDIVNATEFMKEIEFEPMYQKFLDISTLDEFELSEIKTLHRKLEEEKRSRQ